MRKQEEQAERRMQEFKHQMGEKEKEVAAAKEIVEKAAKKEEKKRRKEAEKREAASKLLSDEERQREMKSLAVEAGRMGPPATTSVTGTRRPTGGVENGKSKAQKQRAKASRGPGCSGGILGSETRGWTSDYGAAQGALEY